MSFDFSTPMKQAAGKLEAVILRWLKLLLVLLWLASLISYSARFPASEPLLQHYRAELFTHFTGVYFALGMMLLAGLLALRQGFWVIAAFALVLLNALAVLPWYSPMSNQPTTIASQQQNIRLLQANLLSQNTAHDKLLNLITEKQPDIIVLQEVSNHWQQALAALHPVYPWFKVIAREDNFGIAVFSKLPLESVTEVQLGALQQQDYALRSEDKINTETGRRIFIHFQGVKTGA
ncbi:Endonuclease/Exonuclease/phosphatase family protein [Candidatus Venteria ishoeyi]|uniref:Endonuclease/Exonuclease/phosphatase family protein n=2 Tax=Candidatus Venteria ishoeyi TaxID=1899563 RepID=A0A1H6FG62_9GAMM|nr:Endonuclease/Exonuclease/phosphatase family protein [Candidatus Venteria ishoeyi]